MTEKVKGNIIRKYLLAHEETIAVAESVTSGMLQLFLSTLVEAQQFYQGGITAYNIGQKCKHLAVEPIHAEKTNCVSAKVAEQMALNVCKMFCSTWGIAITGYATPVPESGHKRYCYFAIAYGGSIKASGKIDSKKMPPQKVQEVYKNAVIDTLTELMN